MPLVRSRRGWAPHLAEHTTSHVTEAERAPPLLEGDEGRPVAQDGLSHDHGPGQAHEEVVIAEQLEGQELGRAVDFVEPAAILLDPHHEDDEECDPCQPRQIPEHQVLRPAYDASFESWSALVNFQRHSIA